MGPWFWILVAALAVVAIGALVLAISASNEGVDQKKLSAQATKQIEGEVAGLEEALQAADEVQEESQESAAAARRRINRDVEEAVAGGEAELQKVKGRVRALEGEAASSAAADQRLEKSIAGLTQGRERLDTEVGKLEAQVGRLERQSEQR